MSWREQTDRVLSGCVTAFGETITYIPALDPEGDGYALEAIFSTRYEAVDPDTGAAVTTEQPNLGVRLSQMESPPAQHDVVLLGDGRRYEVASIERDSGGGAKLLLHEAPEIPDPPDPPDPPDDDAPPDPPEDP